MTLLRAPVSIEQALLRIAGSLTWNEMADVVGVRSGRTVRRWSEPDKPELPTLMQCARLDAAFRRAGGIGAPLHEVMGHLIEAACCDAYPTADEIGRRAVRCIKEGGEAHAALVIASRPDASDLERLTAAREVEEAIAELSGALPLLAPKTLSAVPALLEDR